MLENKELQSYRFYHKSFNNFATIQIWPVLIIFGLIIIGSFYVKKSVYVVVPGRYIIKKEALQKNKNSKQWIANLQVKDGVASAQVHQNVKLSYNGNPNFFKGTISNKYHKESANYYEVQLEPFKPSIKHNQIIGKMNGDVFLEVKRITYWNYLTKNIVINN